MEKKKNEGKNIDKESEFLICFYIIAMLIALFAIPVVTLVFVMCGKDIVDSFLSSFGIGFFLSVFLVIIEAILFARILQKRNTDHNESIRIYRKSNKIFILNRCFFIVMILLGIGGLVWMNREIFGTKVQDENNGQNIFQNKIKDLSDQIDEDEELEVVSYGDSLYFSCSEGLRFSDYVYKGFKKGDEFDCELGLHGVIEDLDQDDSLGAHFDNIRLWYATEGVKGLKVEGGASSVLDYDIKDNGLVRMKRNTELVEKGAYVNFSSSLLHYSLLRFSGVVEDSKNAKIEIYGVYYDTHGSHNILRKNGEPIAKYDPWSIKDVNKEITSSLYAYNDNNEGKIDFYKKDIDTGEYVLVNTYILQKGETFINGDVDRGEGTITWRESGEKCVRGDFDGCKYITINFETLEKVTGNNE